MQNPNILMCQGRVLRETIYMFRGNIYMTPEELPDVTFMVYIKLFQV